MANRPRPAPETALYADVKAFLEAQGFAVKGEICGCDIVAVRDGEPPVLVVTELKQAFTLELLLQAVDRMRAADAVWLAVRASGRGRDRDRRVHRLCRLLGLGLLVVHPRGGIDILAQPEPYRPPAAAAPAARTRHAARRPDGWRQRTATGHDGVSPAGIGLRRRIAGSRPSTTRPAPRDTRRRAHPAAQRLRLVRARRAWPLSAGRRRHRGAAAVDAGVNRPMPWWSITI